MIFFTADLHFGHKNVISYCNRPWPDVESMNEGLISNWNSIVKAEDEVWVLGDVAFMGKTKIKEILSRLKGRKFLVVGNHDLKFKMHHWEAMGFSDTYGFSTMTLNAAELGPILVGHLPYKNQDFADSRYEPLKPDNRGAWLLHGHVHNAWKVKDNMINVGVDVWDYRPVSIDDIKLIMDNK